MLKTKPQETDTLGLPANSRSALDHAGTTDIPAVEVTTDHPQSVHPDELVAALAAIERRERRLFTGRMDIESALRQLDTDVTVEEVWQEIEHRRQQKIARKTATPIPRQRRWNPLAISALALGVCAIGLYNFLGQIPLLREQIVSATSTTSRESVTTAPPQPYIWAPSIYLRGPNTKPVTSLKNGDVLVLDLLTATFLNKVFSGDRFYAPTPIHLQKEVFLDTTPHPNGFNIARQEGRLYLRAWVTQEDRQRLQADHRNSTAHPLGLVVYPRLMERTKATEQVQIPLDAVRDAIPMNSSSGYSGQITLDATKLDATLTLPWKPADVPAVAVPLGVPEGKTLYSPPQ